METHRTIFYKPKQEDYKDLLNLYINLEVRKYLGGPISKEKFDEIFKDFFSAKLPTCYFCVKEKQSNNFIGLVSIDKHHNGINYEISYELNPIFWGKGYGTEIVKEGIKYAFSVLDLKELWAETQKKNINSIKLLKKCGMKLTKELKRFGEQQVIYAIKK